MYDREDIGPWLTEAALGSGRPLGLATDAGSVVNDAALLRSHLWIALYSADRAGDADKVTELDRAVDLAHEAICRVAVVGGNEADTPEFSNRALRRLADALAEWVANVRDWMAAGIVGPAPGLPVGLSDQPSRERATWLPRWIAAAMRRDFAPLLANLRRLLARSYRLRIPLAPPSAGGPPGRIVVSGPRVAHAPPGAAVAPCSAAVLASAA